MGGPIDEISTEFLRHSDPEKQDWSDAKYFWVPDDHHGFITVQQIEQAPDDLTIKAIRRTDNVVETVRRDSLLPANSSRFDRHEDMAELGELNEATILHCLKSRYQSGLIYTYSGLFLVAVNPYRELPIYSAEVVQWFKGQARQERPPHIYAVADAALADLLRSKQNQSILITYNLY
jgi:myosin heavy subunit